jgi:hypothetical protein
MRTEYKLLRSQKNQILESIKLCDLDPFNFKWTEHESDYLTDGENYSLSVERLTYEDVTFYFQFDYSGQKRYCIFSPGRERCIEQLAMGSWLDQLVVVGSWLKYLTRELTQPDLWSDLSKYHLMQGEILTADIGNEPFTVKEAEQLSEGIRKVRAYIAAEFTLSADQQDLVNEKLDYLLEASKRQGRKDWFHTSIGVIISLAATMAFSPEQTKNIWSILKGAINGIIYILR